MTIDLTMHPNTGERYTGKTATIFKNKVAGVMYSDNLKATCLILDTGGILQVNESKEQILNLMGNSAQGYKGDENNGNSNNNTDRSSDNAGN
jgi:hypothetical protein